MTEPPAEEVLRALDVILSSSDFDKSARSRRFLEYVVRARLDGWELEISQNTLAAEVFDRKGLFDPNTDPIVRMQAGRVRRSLEHYYLTHRDYDLVKIVLPKGTYVPEFLNTEGTKEIESKSGSQGLRSGETLSGCEVPVIVICPFANLTGNPEFDFLARGLSMHIAVEANQNRDVRVFVNPVDPFSGSTTDSTPLPGDLSDGLILRGAILTNGTMLRLDAQLIQYETRRQIWAHRFLQSSSEIEVAKFLENTARQVALMLLSESGVLHRLQARHLGSASSTHPNTHEAILRYLDWIVSHRPENFERVVQSLQMAVEQDSRSGMARSFLARCYADLWALDFGGGPVRIEDALDLALEGLSRNPDDCRAEGAAGYVYLVMDRLDSARQHAEAALIKTGGSSLFLDVISWLLTLCGEWDRGSANLRKAIRENPFHSPFVHGALCFEAIRREDYTLALKEARATKSSSNFWGPLMRCVALVYLGRIDEAHRFRDEVLQIQPGFLERGDWLIRRYAKDNSVVERIKEGLAIAGLRVT